MKARRMKSPHLSKGKHPFWTLDQTAMLSLRAAVSMPPRAALGETGVLTWRNGLPEWSNWAVFAG